MSNVVKFGDRKQPMPHIMYIWTPVRRSGLALYRRVKTPMKMADITVRMDAAVTICPAIPTGM